MATPPKIRVNTQVPFPSLVAGGNGIQVNKSNGIWTIAINPNASFTSTTPGFVPMSGGGTANFLRADGVFAPPIPLNASSKSGAPSNTDLADGTWELIDDTSNNQTWLVFNKGGTIRKVQLT